MRAWPRRPRILVLLLAALLACPGDDALATDDGLSPTASVGGSRLLTAESHLVPSQTPSIRTRPGSSSSRKRLARILHVAARDTLDDTDASDPGLDAAGLDLRAIPDLSLELRIPGGPRRGTSRTSDRAGLHTAVLGTRLRC